MATQSVPPGTTRPAVARQTPPGPRGNILLGSLRDLHSDRLKFVLDLQRNYGDIVRYRLTMLTFYQVSHPDYVKHILQDNHRNYTKGSILGKLLSPVVGQGLFTSEGELWLRQRRLMQPVFHRKHIAAFGTIMTDATGRMLDSWEARESREEPINILAEMMRLTLNIVTRALFGADVSAQAEIVARAFTTASEHTTYRFDFPFYPTRLPTARNRRFGAALRDLDRVVHELIAARQGSSEDTGDLLSMLLSARDQDTGEGMSPTQLRDEVVTLLLAGHETTANALAWTWYLLSEHPTVEARLHAELEAALGGRLPTMADLPSLDYCRMVFEEAMRLYPPVWLTQRQAIADDEIGGFHIPAGTTFSLSPWVTHRRADIWPDPERFDPERFTPERVAERPRFAYFPFSGGPRLCIGQSFAMAEAQLVMATIAQRYRLRLAAGHSVKPEAQLTLRPKGGLPMVLHRT